MAAPNAPYPHVRVHTDESVAQDASLQAFVVRLRTAVAKGDLAWINQALARDFAVVVCEGGTLAPCAPGAGHTRTIPGTTPAERLRIGLTTLAQSTDPNGDTDLDDADEPMGAGVSTPPAQPPSPQPAPPMPGKDADLLVIGQLASLLETTSLGSHPDVPGVACLPAWPLLDRTAARRVLAVAKDDEEDLRVATSEVPVYATPNLEAVKIGTLAKGDLVPLLDTSSDPPPGWSALRLPDGRMGYAEDLGLDDIITTGPCFAHENGASTGPWKISFLALRDR